ncbi:MAG: hypothetical protein IIY06_06620 [Proteobacteria bacterium]|nr:hypothetical protein [Pseudomonadota bacterium]
MQVTFLAGLSAMPIRPARPPMATPYGVRYPIGRFPVFPMAGAQHAVAIKVFPNYP